MIRQPINMPLPLPSDAAHLIIVGQYKFRSEKDGERFFIFATPRQLNILSRSCNIFFDSTFK
ncbi:hypothetical protein HZS_545 [Henneguya salminicola]|nr:hypothetical protein HZS_545 [Henneguya salminicola]